MYLQDYVVQNNLKYYTIQKFIIRHPELFNSTATKKDGKIWLTKKGIAILDAYYSSPSHKKDLKEITKMKTEIENLKQSEKILQEKNREYENQINLLSEKVTSLKQSNHTLFNDSISHRKSIAQYRDQIEQLKIQIKLLEEENNELKNRSFIDLLRKK